MKWHSALVGQVRAKIGDYRTSSLRGLHRYAAASSAGAASRPDRNPHIGIGRHRLRPFCRQSRREPWCCRVRAEQSAADGQESSRFLRAAGSIGAISTVAKVLGLVREASIAAVFGLSPAADAYNCALLLPSFVVTVVAGLNGPLQSAFTAVLSKSSPGDARASRGALQAATVVIFGSLSLALFFWRGHVISLIAPGLSPATAQLAAQQLGLLAPAVVLSATAAVSMSELAARNAFAAPAAAPALASAAVIGALVWPADSGADMVTRHALATAAGYSAGTALGAGAMALAEASLPRLREVEAAGGIEPAASGWWPADARGRVTAVRALRDAVAVFIPAVASSVLMAAVGATDLAFASAYPGGAAALSLAFLLAMAPIGVASTSLVAPLLPLLARKHALGDTAAFSRAVSRAVATAFAVGALLAGTWGALAEPIVKLTLQRSAFDAASAAAVSSLLMIYTVGAAAYMARDVLGRACYAMGEGAAPLAGSVMAVGVNAGLNWLLGVKAGWGAAGIAAATVATNALSALPLLVWLAHRLPELRWVPKLSAAAVCAAAGALAAGVSSAGFAAIHVHVGELLGSTPLGLWIVDAVALLFGALIGTVGFVYALGASGHPLLAPGAHWVLRADKEDQGPVD